MATTNGATKKTVRKSSKKAAKKGATKTRRRAAQLNLPGDAGHPLSVGSVKWLGERAHAEAQRMRTGNGANGAMADLVNAFGDAMEAFATGKKVECRAALIGVEGGARVLLSGEADGTSKLVLDLGSEG